MERLSLPIRRGLALTLLLIGTAIIWAATVSPFLSALEDRRLALQTSHERLLRYEDLLAKSDDVRDWSAKSAEMSYGRLLFEADTPALGAANLQRYLANIGSRIGVNLTNSEILRESNEGTLTRIGVQTSFRGRQEPLVRFLQGLLTGDKIVEVTELTIITPFPQRGGAEPEIRIDIEAHAFMKRAKD